MEEKVLETRENLLSALHAKRAEAEVLEAKDKELGSELETLKNQEYQIGE